MGTALALVAERSVYGEWGGGLARLTGGPASQERATIVADIAPRVPDALLGQTVELITSFSRHELDDSMAAAAPRMSRVQRRALLDKVAASDYDWYATAVKALAPYLDPELVEYALQFSLSRRDTAFRTWALVALIPNLDLEQLARARDRMARLRGELDHLREAAAAAVGSRLAKLGEIDDARDIATRAPATPRWMSEAVTGMPPHVDEPRARRRLEQLVSGIGDVELRTDALGALAARADENESARLIQLALAGTTEAANPPGLRAGHRQLRNHRHHPR
jgi:hypothetical protein